MTKQQIDAIIASKQKGQFSTITYRKVLKTRKGVDALISKETVMQGRLGCRYDNLKAVKEGRADGTLPSENQGLPKGTEWLEDGNPYYIKSTKSGAISLRISKGGNPSKVSYFLNGCPVDKEVIIPMCLAVEFPKYDASKPAPSVINVGIEKIKEIK